MECLIITLPQVSAHELFLIEAKKKALAYTEWLKESEIRTAELLAEIREYRAAHADGSAKLQEVLQGFHDDIPSYRICPFKAPMHEQNLNAAGKCNRQLF